MLLQKSMLKYIFLLFFASAIISGCYARSDNDEAANDSETVHEEQNQNQQIRRTWLYIDPLGERLTLNTFPAQRDFSHVSKFSNLEEVYFHAANIDKIDFSPFFGLEKLRTIDITCYDDSFVEFPDLSGVKNLKSLEILGASIQSFQNIRKKLPDIEYLRFGAKDYWGIEISDLDTISEIPSLKRLDMNIGSNLTIRLSDFHGLKNLEHFQTYIRGTIDFVGAENLISLKYFDARSSSLLNVQYLSNITTLEAVHLRIDESTKNLDFLSNLVNLRSLTLDNKVYTWSSGPLEAIRDHQLEIDVSPLKNLLQLKSLSFCGFVIKNIVALAELPVLDVIYVYDTFILPDNSVRELSRVNGESIWVDHFVSDR